MTETYSDSTVWDSRTKQATHYQTEAIMSLSEVFLGSLGTLKLQQLINRWTQQGPLSWATLVAVMAGPLLYCLGLAIYRRMFVALLQIYLYLG